jgi:hypothetical protein
VPPFILPPVPYARLELPQRENANITPLRWLGAIREEIDSLYPLGKFG